MNPYSDITDDEADDIQHCESKRERNRDIDREIDDTYFEEIYE